MKPFVRPAESIILPITWNLPQEYIVDNWCKVVQQRLNWIRLNQVQLRAQLYCGVADAIYHGDTDSSALGSRVVLPSTFVGSPRYMHQKFQVRDFPVLFSG